ncbi:MAG: LysE family translocator [Actinophytocola sp.]|uniref:LysE family translocator n=1 Tax=Actinophytocola sp. TaxID=1872138 RepID=UPI003D6A683E
MDVSIPPPATLALFAGTAFLLVIVPGPNMLFILSKGIISGRRAAFASAFGVELGTLVHVVGTVIGISALIAASPVAFNILKYAGAAYLLYLAWGAFRAQGSGLSREVPDQTLLRTLGSAALVNVLNPKVALFFLALFPQFIAPELDSVPSQALILGLVFFLIALALDLLYAAGSVAVGRWLDRNPRFHFWQRLLSAATLLALAVFAALA